MSMVRLNIRHQLPQIAIRQQQSRLDESSVVPAQVHTNSRQARSNKGATQSSIQIDNYPSRRAYGVRNMTDFTAERGQKGISDVRSATSAHTQEGWTRATNAGKRGDDVAQKAYNDMMGKYSADVVFEMNLMPEPDISVNPSQVVGESDVGDVTAEIDSSFNARLHFTPGKAQTYLQNEGYLRQWVSLDRYDIYA